MGWLQAAVPLILQQDLAGAPSLFAFAASRSSDGYARNAAEEVEVTAEQNPHIQLTVDIRDLHSQQTVQAYSLPPSEDVISAVNAIAKRLDSHASTFSTTNEASLRDYIDGLETPDPTARAAKLQAAVQKDPSFGLAYLSLIEAESQANSPQLPATLAAAKAHESAFVPYNRARLQFLLARASHQSLPAIANAAAGVVDVAPHDAEALSALGQARFLQGNGAAGQKALMRALELEPDNGRLREQLAAGFLETRDFVRAEQIWEQMNGAPGSAIDLATAILLSGDRARAEAVLEQSLAPKSGERVALASVIRAQWAGIGGSDVANGPKQGLAILDMQANSTGDIAALAAAQQCVWLMQTGRKTEANAAATRALQSAINLQVKQAAQTVAFIVQSDATPQLEARLQSAHADPAATNIVLGYGAFLYGDYPAAITAWRKVLQISGDTDLRSRAMLASCLRRAGDNRGAFDIVLEPFVPDLSGADPFATIAFNEMRQLLRL